MEFSIITINYNNKSGLQRTIGSVLCQTWKNYEWIIIDGGSTDGSKELIEQYQQHFAYWCSERDRGVYHAMNKGISKATGEYLNFMNSGDAFNDENVLQKINDLHSDADIIWGQAVGMTNQKIQNVYCGNLFIQLYKSTLCHQGTFIRRALLLQYPYDEALRIVSDWKFWLQTIVFGQARVERTEIVIARYEGGGISSASTPESKALFKNEREGILGSFFPKLLRDEIDEYVRLRRSPYIVYGDYLQKSNHMLFAIGWRIIKLLSLLDKYMSKCFLHK